MAKQQVNAKVDPLRGSVERRELSDSAARGCFPQLGETLGTAPSANNKRKIKRDVSPRSIGMTWA
jgi:hypothetical protein